MEINLDNCSTQQTEPIYYLYHTDNSKLKNQEIIKNTKPWDRNLLSFRKLRGPETDNL